MLTVAETIASATRVLLESRNGLLLGQCLSAVGWVGGTVPQLPGHPGIVELSMADVAGGGVAVGAALGGERRAVYIIRYQGFLWYNAISIVNYAAKSWELWGVPCPLLVRAIAMEGSIGPVAGNYHHSLLLRTPGVNVACPMTPSEWLQVWSWHWQGQKTPTVISEHRLSFPLTEELVSVKCHHPVVTVLAIGASRLNALEAVRRANDEGVMVELYHQVWLAPFQWPDGFLESVTKTTKCLIVDSDYTEWSTASTLAARLGAERGTSVRCLGLEHRSAGFSEATDNKTPSVDQIFKELLDFGEASVTSQQPII